MPEALLQNAPENWEAVTLREICASGGGDIQTGPFGSQLHASDYVDDGIPSVMPQNIGDNVINEEGIARIKPEDAARLNRYLLVPGDIVYSRRGDVERRALVQAEHSGWLCGTGCLRVRPGSRIDSRFLSYYLGHPAVGAWIVRHAIGATMRNLNTQILGDVPALLPPKETQAAISAVLGALDNKIAVNDRIIHSCHVLGDTHLAKSGPSALSDGATLADLADSKILEFGDGYRTKRSELGYPGLPILRVAEVMHGRIEPSMSEFVREEYRRSIGPKASRPGDIVLTTKGTVGRVALLSDRDSEFVYSPQVCFFRIRSGEFPSNYYLYFWFRSSEFVRQAQHLKGQTDMADYLSLSDVRTLKIGTTDGATQRELEGTLRVLADEISAVTSESRTLEQMRDALLPKLMSGELRVREAEKIVEKAV